MSSVPPPLSPPPPAVASTSQSSTPGPFLSSPHSIPPRTSSTGAAASASSPSARASILRPVAEADWMSQTTHPRSPPSAHTHHRNKASSTPSSMPALPSANILLNMAASGHALGHASTTTPPPPERPDPSRFAHSSFGFIDGAPRSFSTSKDRVIMGPFDYLNSQRGKDFRSQLIAAFNTWLAVPSASLEIITRVVGMLHTASLLIDDVEDNSLLRRGLPVAHALFGVPQTINSANYVYFYALEELQKLNNPRVISVYAEELLNLHRGQGLDLFWRDTLTCPTEDEYLEMVGNKTGGLFRLGIKLMQAESSRRIKRQPPSPPASSSDTYQAEGNDESNESSSTNRIFDDTDYDYSQVPDCVPLVNLIGLIFQIRDDYQNLQSTEYSENKGLAEDLTEGKFSFPIIHSIRSDPGNLQLINILKQRTTEDEVKRYAVKYMEGTGSFEYTLNVLEVLIARARKVAQEIDRKQRPTPNKNNERRQKTDNKEEKPNKEKGKS